MKRCLRCGYDLIDSIEKYCSLCRNRKRRFVQVSPEHGRFDCYADEEADPAFKAARGDFDGKGLES